MNIFDLDMISAKSEYVSLGKMTNMSDPFHEKKIFPFIFLIKTSKDKIIKANFIDKNYYENSKKEDFTIKKINKHYITMCADDIKQIILFDYYSNFTIDILKFKELLRKQLHQDNFKELQIKYMILKENNNHNMFYKININIDSRNKKFQNSFKNIAPFKYYIECLKDTIKA